MAFVVFEVAAPASARAPLRFLLGFEPWQVRSVTPVDSSSYLVEEHFSPQRGTWTRFTLVKDGLEVARQATFADNLTARIVHADAAWVEIDGRVRRFDLSTMSLGDGLKKVAQERLGQRVTSARLTEQGAVIAVGRDDGRSHTIAPIETAMQVVLASVERVRSLKALRGPHTWWIDGYELRKTITGPGVVEQRIAPSFLIDSIAKTPLGFGDSVLVVHQPKADAAPRLISLFAPSSGVQWTLDLQQALQVEGGTAATVWASLAGEHVLLVIDIRAGRSSRTVAALLSESGKLTQRLSLD